MASANSFAAARNIPSYTIPVGPRIRPPRLLPGTKAANTDPQPDEPPPKLGQVWVQGKWRNSTSNAARDRREVQSTQVEKALKHATHGMNIYAYSNIRTNQVVYSLTRVMQNNKVLPQLLYHGKKTVPAALRRDNWRPYFSIHFSETMAGASAGLKTYRRLRELATLRQLSPPSELVIASEEDVKKAKRKFTPYELYEKTKNDDLEDLPVENQVLPLKFRAKKLMDQKASSVADAAHVLGLINQSLSPAEQYDVQNDARAEKHQKWSTRATRRLNRIRDKEAAKQAQIEARQKLTQLKEGRLGLTTHAVKRIALEHGGTIVMPERGVEYTVADLSVIQQQQRAADVDSSLQEASVSPSIAEKRPPPFDAESYRSRYIEAWRERNGHAEDGPVAEDVESAVKSQQARVETQIAEFEQRNAQNAVATSENLEDRNASSRIVQVLWADMRDATWAESWPANVYHGELESRAALKYEHHISRQERTIDEKGDDIPGQRKKVVIQKSTTPHVFGNNEQSGWYETSEQLSAKRQELRDTRTRTWRDLKAAELKKITDSFRSLRLDQSELSEKRDKLRPEIDALKRVETESPGSEFEVHPGTEPIDNVIRNLTMEERDELRISATAVEEAITKVERKLSGLQQHYPSIYPFVDKALDELEGQALYMMISKTKDELGMLDRTADPQDLETSQKLQQIDMKLSKHAERFPALADIDSIQTNLLSRIAKRRKSISEYENLIAQLEATGESQQVSDFGTNEPSPSIKSRLSEAQLSLENERQYLASDVKDTFSRRVDAMYRALEDYETEHGSALTDLLTQRVQLERDGDTAELEQIDRQLKAHAENEMMVELGLQASEVETTVREYDADARERGLEQPPPPRKGIWGRFKGMFGR